MFYICSMSMIHKIIPLKIITATCLWVAVIISSSLYAQETERKISGTITSESGEPIPQVFVTLKGTTRMTSSDTAEKYAIIVSRKAILYFSSIGFESQEVVVGNRSEIDIVMKEGEGESMLLKDGEFIPLKESAVKGITPVNPADLKIDTKGIAPAKPIDLTEQQQKKANSDNDFGFKMFREISKLQGDDIFFSPFILNMAMGLLYNGASGDTYQEMDEILNMAALPEEGFNAYYRTISQKLPEIDPTTEIAIANAIWYRDDIQPKEDFIETGKKYFDADVQALDFNNAKSAGIINEWCKSRTGGKIKNLRPVLYPDDRIILTNAIYFKSQWQKEKKFDKKKTKPDDFIKSDQTKSRVNMMEQITYLSYYVDPYLQCVEMPYGNKAFSMVAILPPENEDMDQLIEYLSDVKWDQIVNGMKSQRVWLKMPRFRLECELTLSQSLRNRGMGSILNGNFTNIADTDLFLSGIIQKTFVEVNEEGTEAGAAVASMIAGSIGGLPEEPIPFFANRPFLFMIRERSTGVILFIGRIDDPRE